MDWSMAAAQNRQSFSRMEYLIKSTLNLVHKSIGHYKPLHTPNLNHDHPIFMIINFAIEVQQKYLQIFHGFQRTSSYLIKLSCTLKNAAFFFRILGQYSTRLECYDERHVKFLLEQADVLNFQSLNIRGMHECHYIISSKNSLPEEKKRAEEQMLDLFNKNKCPVTSFCEVSKKTVGYEQLESEYQLLAAQGFEEPLNILLNKVAHYLEILLAPIMKDVVFVGTIVNYIDDCGLEELCYPHEWILQSHFLQLKNLHMEVLPTLMLYFDVKQQFLYQQLNFVSRKNKEELAFFQNMIFLCQAQKDAYYYLLNFSRDMPFESCQCNLEEIAKATYKSFFMHCLVCFRFSQIAHNNALQYESQDVVSVEIPSNQMPDNQAPDALILIESQSKSKINSKVERTLTSEMDINNQANIRVTDGLSDIAYQSVHLIWAQGKTEILVAMQAVQVEEADLLVNKHLQLLKLVNNHSDMHYTNLYDAHILKAIILFELRSLNQDALIELDEAQKYIIDKQNDSKTYVSQWMQLYELKCLFYKKQEQWVLYQENARVASTFAKDHDVFCFRLIQEDIIISEITVDEMVAIVKENKHLIQRLLDKHLPPMVISTSMYAGFHEVYTYLSYYSIGIGLSQLLDAKLKGQKILKTESLEYITQGISIDMNLLEFCETEHKNHERCSELLIKLTCTFAYLTALGMKAYESQYERYAEQVKTYAKKWLPTTLQSSVDEKLSEFSQLVSSSKMNPSNVLILLTEYFFKNHTKRSTLKKMVSTAESQVILQQLDQQITEFYDLMRQYLLFSTIKQTSIIIGVNFASEQYRQKIYDWFDVILLVQCHLIDCKISQMIEDIRQGFYDWLDRQNGADLNSKNGLIKLYNFELMYYVFLEILHKIEQATMMVQGLNTESKLVSLTSQKNTLKNVVASLLAFTDQKSSLLQLTKEECKKDLLDFLLSDIALYGNNKNQFSDVIVDYAHYGMYGLCMSFIWLEILQGCVTLEKSMQLHYNFLFNIFSWNIDKVENVVFVKLQEIFKDQSSHCMDLLRYMKETRTALIQKETKNLKFFKNHNEDKQNSRSGVSLPVKHST